MLDPTYAREDLFNLLSDDLLLLCFSFMDVSCLAALSQTCKREEQSISEVVSNEAVWFKVVNRRFNLIDSHGGNMGNSYGCRPKHYGGPTWKDAYRSMDKANRLPKLRVALRKKVTFAKGGTCNETSRMKVGVDQCVAMWCMINHTEDCRLRSTNERIYDDHREVDMQDGTYIELQVAFQNKKSGFCTVDVDVSKITVQMRSSKSGVNSFLVQPIERKGALRPKVIYRSIGENVTYLDNSLKKRKRQRNGVQRFSNQNSRVMSKFQTLKSEDDKPLILTLKPFEFAVCSVNVPLSYYRERGEFMRFETCFLSRAVSMCTPITRHKCSLCTDNNEITPELLDEEFTYETKSSLEEICSSSLFAVAKFSADEDVIWNNYSELPGGFMSLRDRTQLGLV